MAGASTVCPQRRTAPETEHAHRRNQRQKLNSPTAAFLLPENMINARTNTMLSPQTIMFAMLPKLPSEPAFKIPQSGFTPTGALFGSAEAPVKTVDVVLELLAICNRVVYPLVR
jgi:hypothetical protein